MNYAEIEQEEMMYLDGVDAKTFGNNVYGMLKRFGISQANRISWGIPPLTTLAKATYIYATAKYGFITARIASFTGNPIVIGVAALGAVAAVTYLWNKRV